MTYRCPHCGAELYPADGKRLFCWPCGDYWRSNGRGRLKRAQRTPAVGDLERTKAQLLGQD